MCRRLLTEQKEAMGTGEGKGRGCNMRSEHNGGTLVDAGGESAAGDGDRRENGLNVEHWCVVEVCVLVSGFFFISIRVALPFFILFSLLRPSFWLCVRC